jgi:hypothetical protein
MRVTAKDPLEELKEYFEGNKFRVDKTGTKLKVFKGDSKILQFEIVNLRLRTTIYLLSNIPVDTCSTALDTQLQIKREGWMALRRRQDLVNSMGPATKKGI